MASKKSSGSKATAEILPFKRAAKKKPARKVEDLWGKVLVARGFTSLPTLLFHAQGRLGLTPDELNVVLQIAIHRWDANETPFLAKETIATRMGKDARTVQRHLTSLEKKGLVRRIKRYRPAGQGQTANGFALDGLIRKLEEVEPEFRKVSEQNKNRRRRVETPVAAKKGA